MQGEEAPVTSAQVRAGRALTEMLRAKYNLAAENCITHAQVSVNPSNMRIGWHTDWGSRFPYVEMGLTNNYEIPNPSLYYFGFDYDPLYLSSSGAELQKGLTAAEERVSSEAAARGLTTTVYRGVLRQRYAKVHATLRHRSTAQEKFDE
jgi:hypothetical protein